MHGTPLLEAPPAHVTRPVMKAVQAQFLIARAAARHMVRRGSGVILTVTGGDRDTLPLMGGTTVAWAAMEALCRQWACELGPRGVRVAWLRLTGVAGSVPETAGAFPDYRGGSGEGMTGAELVAWMREDTLLKRLPTLTEVGCAAAFAASDWAGAMTASALNVTCGALVD